MNLKFVSAHYGMSPDDVASMRAKGQSFVSVHDHGRKAKRQEKAKLAAQDNQGGNSNPGQGKSKKK